MLQQEILLDCDQSNVLLTHIIFFSILLRALSFLSACIRDPVTVVIGLATVRQNLKRNIFITDHQ